MRVFSSGDLIPRHRRQAWLDEGRMNQEEQDYPHVDNPEPCPCGSGELARHFLDPDADPVCIVCYYDGLEDITP